MDIVVTRVADLDPHGGIACSHCSALVATFDIITDTHKPPVEELFVAGAVPIPNFGWFCSQECASAYSREHGVAFQCDSSGRVTYY